MTSRASLFGILSLVAVCALTPAVIAQEGNSQQRQFIIEGDGVIVIEGGNITIRQQGMQPMFHGADPIPPDAELARVPVSDEIRELVKQLDAEEFHIREAATRALIDSRRPNAELYAVLARRGELSPEQRRRLLNALVERLLYAPRGALGIRMESGPNQFQQGEVRVTDLIPGLPAERVLRIGDRITHIEGHPVAAANDLIALVQSRRPGDLLSFVVLRSKADGGNERLELTVELGSSELLVDPTTGAQSVSQFDNARRIEAMAAEQRFAPPTRELRLRGR